MPGPGTQATLVEAHMPGILEAEPPGGPGRRLTVPGRAAQVPRVRAFIAGTLAAHGLRGETACLLGTELVTNSIRHSDSGLPGGTITVTVRTPPGEVRVEVTDNGGVSVPELREGADPCAEDGRGLLLVAALSARWGFRRARRELMTWFQISAEPDRLASRDVVPPEPGRSVPLHSPEPADGAFRTRDGQHADLFNLRHYPVRAKCRVCGQEIEADSFLRPFQHVAGKRRDPGRRP